MGKKIVYSFTPERTSQKLTNAELAFAGFFSAVPTTTVAAPMERVKVLLQVSRGFGTGWEMTRELRHLYRCKGKEGSSFTAGPLTSCARSMRREGSRACSAGQARLSRVTVPGVPREPSP